MSVGLTQLAFALATIETLEHQIAALEAAVTQLARGERVEDLPPIQTSRDRIWPCKNCGARLGVYDETADVMRIKYKDLFMSFRSGPGGFVSTLCRSCGVENRADYVAE